MARPSLAMTTEKNAPLALEAKGRLAILLIILDREALGHTLAILRQRQDGGFERASHAVGKMPDSGAEGRLLLLRRLAIERQQLIRLVEADLIEIEAGVVAARHFDRAGADQAIAHAERI